MNVSVGCSKFVGGLEYFFYNVSVRISKCTSVASRSISIIIGLSISMRITRRINVGISLCVRVNVSIGL